MINLRRLKISAPPDPLISVLVRIKNEGTALAEFWDRLSSQTIFQRAEIIFLDSGSTDDSIDQLMKREASLYQIDSQDFNFGSSCNLLMSLSHAPIAIFLSGHVLLEEKDALEILQTNLAKYEYAAGFFRQVPNTLWGSTTYEKAYLSRRYPLRPSEVAEVTTPSGFSNAASGITRAAWKRISFPEIHGSEDYVWAEKHLRLGGKLFYFPRTCVMHSHRESPPEIFRRALINTHARKIKGSYLTSMFYFGGIFFSMLWHGAALKEAWRYASAHSRAYLPRWANQI